jgi:hypothetical protein
MKMTKLLSIIPAMLLVLAAAAASIRQGNAAQTVGTCTVSGVAVFDNRIHVRCSVPVGGFTFFAVAVSNSANAARLLTLFNSARTYNRQLSIWYDPNDLTGASFGCQNSDCRVARGAELL